MKQAASEVRNKLIVVRLNESEYNKLHSLFKQSADRYLSNYIRKVILQKPVTIKYRNASVDDFLKEMMPLRKELIVIGNNFNEVVRKLNPLQKIPEFRSWIAAFGNIKEEMEMKINDIKSKIIQLYDQWLQK